jgi:two-component system, OmpR family, response regulator
VLFLTALDAVHERVAGFHAGGDDYLTKPFALSELVVRVEALARRKPPLPSATSGLRLDPARFTIRSDRAEAALTPTEFRMLAALLGRPGEVVRRRALVAAGWPDGAIVNDNTVDSFIRRIRTKLSAVDETTTIETVRGVGYAIR